MKRRLFNCVGVLSLLLLVATIILWVRSERRGDWLLDAASLRKGGGHDGGLYARSWRGVIVLYKPKPPLLTLYTRTFEHLYEWRCLQEDWGRLRWPAYGRGSVEWWVAVPYWVVALFFLVVSVAGLWRRKKRVKEGFCRTCNYDLRASAERCPECGTPMIHKPGEISNLAPNG